MSQKSDLKVGQTFNGKVIYANSRLGVFVEIIPNVKGALYISEMIGRGIDDKMETFKSISVGQAISVSIISIDGCGRIELSQTTE